MSTPDKTVSTNYRKNQPFKTKQEDKTFVNPSWEESEKFTKEAMKWAIVIEGLAQDITTASKKMHDALFEAYRRAPIVDCSYGDSPIGPTKQIFHLKAYLKKLGWAGITIRDVLTPTIQIQDFSKVIKAGCDWVLKFKNEKAN